jgi:hypothetical protein
MTFWTSSSGRIELSIPQGLASIGYHSGACDSDIEELLEWQPIKAQLSGIPHQVLREELKEFGAWDSEELANHEDNLARILWIACGDLVDGMGDEE